MFNSMILNWEVVLNAIIFFISNQLEANTLDIIVVNLLKKVIISIEVWFNIKENFILSNTLATTIVDECSNEDTGVGLSIAIGNQ